MIYKLILHPALCLLPMLSACISSHQDISAADSATTIELEQPVHFAQPDGQPFIAPAGRYRVEPTTETGLRLIPEGSLPPLLVAAEKVTHDIDISIPFALTFAEREDNPHVLILLPGGHSLDAVGSLSGVWPRDAPRVTRHYQFNPQTGGIQFGEGVLGERPPAGQANVLSSHRMGTGAAGNVASNRELRTIQLQSVISQPQTASALTAAIVTAQHEHFRLEYNVNRPGNGDYARLSASHPEACRATCSGDETCQAFTFVKSFSGATSGQCILKRVVPPPVSDGCCVSGKRNSAQEDRIGNIR